MSHANAPLTPAGRLRLIQRCASRPIAHVAAEAGVSRACLSKWVNRHRQLGETGLLDRSSAPHASPSQIPAELVELIEAWRREHKWTGREIAAELARHGDQVSVATVGRWLVRLGISRRADLDPDGNNNRVPSRGRGHAGRRPQPAQRCQSRIRVSALRDRRVLPARLHRTPAE